MNSPLLLLLITLLPLLCHSYTAAVVELAPQYVQWIVDRPKALAIQRANLATFDVNTKPQWNIHLF
jgi:hypothetical protein